MTLALSRLELVLVPGLLGLTGGAMGWLAVVDGAQ